MSSSSELFDDAELIEAAGIEIPLPTTTTTSSSSSSNPARRSTTQQGSSNNSNSRNSFTADSPYYTSYCERELRQVSVLSQTLKEISSRAKTFGKCGALMAESTRRLSGACRLQESASTDSAEGTGGGTAASSSDDEGDVLAEAKQEKEERAMAERKEAIGKDMSSVLELLAEVLDEVASAQVQMCEALEASLVVSLESFADSEMQQVLQLKADAEIATDVAESSFARYLNGRHADKLLLGSSSSNNNSNDATTTGGGATPQESWNKVSEQVSSRLNSQTPKNKRNNEDTLSSPPNKARRAASNASSAASADPDVAMAMTAANLQLTLEQIRLAQAAAELKRFQLLKKLVSIKKRRNFELGESALASLHGIRAYFNNCSDLVQGLAPRLTRIQNTQSACREKHASQQAPWDAREDGLVRGMESVNQAVTEASETLEAIAQQGDESFLASQPTLLGDIEQETEIWNLPSMLAQWSRYQRDAAPGVLVEGWLYKKSSSRMALQQWSRRWFMMDKDGIYYFHSSAEIKKANSGGKNGGYLHTLERVKICDTVLCMVREVKNDGLRFRFEIVTPNQRPLQLQARGPAEYKMWVDGIRLGAQNQLVHGDLSPDALMQGLGKKRKKKKGGTTSSGETLATMVDAENTSMSPRSTGTGAEEAVSSNHVPTPQFHESDQEFDSDAAISVAAAAEASTGGPRNPMVQDILDANPVCADCGKPSPDWACINLGVLVCIECSGVHRGLGVHVSKVRSLRMDALSDWEARLLLSLGNDKVNPIWEAGLESQRGWKKPTADDDRKTKEDWIKSKYQWKGFLEVDSSDGRGHDERTEQANRDLYAAAADADLMGVAEALAHGGNVDWKNPREGGKTALHACAVSTPSYGDYDDDSEKVDEWLGIECVELLLQNGAKMKALDDNHQCPLDCAVIGGAERDMIEYLSARSQ